MREARSIARKRRYRDQSASGLLLHVCQDAPCVVRCYRPPHFPDFTCRQTLSDCYSFSVRSTRKMTVAARTAAPPTAPRAGGRQDVRRPPCR